MQVVRNWLKLRRETFRRLRWLRPVLLIVDVIFVIVGVVVSPSIGVMLGVLGIIINELLSPVVVRRIFIKELSAELNFSATLGTKKNDGAKLD